MGKPAQPSQPGQKRTVICCPLCGENLSELSGPQIKKCPNCGFNLTLVDSHYEAPVSSPLPIKVPRFAHLMLAIQAILAALIGSLFLFFASPLYFGLHILIAIIQLSSILVIVLIIFTLRSSSPGNITRIVLIVFSILTLPLGMFAFAAAFSIPLSKQQSATQRRMGGTTGG